MSDVKISFDNEKTARHFVAWLCNAGEQDYWEWMKHREKEDPEGEFTATFRYDFDESDDLKLEVKATSTRLDYED